MKPCCYSMLRTLLLGTIALVVTSALHVRAQASGSSDTAPSVTTVAPTNGETFTSLATIQIAAHAQDVDPGDYVATVEFFQNGESLGATTNNPLAMSPINPFLLVWRNVPSGNYVLTAKATDSRGASSLSKPVFVTVGQPSPLTMVNILATDPEASEIPEVPPGMGMPQRIDPAVFTVSRTGSSDLPLTVFYTTSGTASNGLDYGELAGTVIIPAGSFSAAIEVLPIDDFLAEGTERVVVTLEPPVCIAIYPPLPGCYQVGPSNRAAADILDNDTLSNHPPAVRILKPLDGHTFLSPTNVLILADAVDMDGYVPRVVFFAGGLKIGEEERNFFVEPPPGEHNRYDFEWVNPPAGRHILRVLATDNQGLSAWSDPVAIWVVSTNQPPPPPVVTIHATDAIASEGTNCWRWIGWPTETGNIFCKTNTATFVVRHRGATNESLTVDYCVGGTAINGVDYVELPGAVTIPAGKRSAPIVVVPLADSLPERTETVVLRLFVPPTTLAVVPPYVVGCPGRAAAIIVDNDKPRPVSGVLSDQSFHLVQSGTNGTWRRIEYSSDLIHWTPLCTKMVTDGALHFVDPDAEELPRRFYRAVLDPYAGASPMD